MTCFQECISRRVCQHCHKRHCRVQVCGHPRLHCHGRLGGFCRLNMNFFSQDQGLDNATGWTSEPIDLLAERHPPRRTSPACIRLFRNQRGGPPGRVPDRCCKQVIITISTWMKFSRFPLWPPLSTSTRNHSSSFVPLETTHSSSTLRASAQLSHRRSCDTAAAQTGKHVLDLPGSCSRANT